MRVKEKIDIAIQAVVLITAALAVAMSAPAQTLEHDTLRGMKWRLVGPFRGGRVLAVGGITGESNTYYFGAVAGGVWKTTDGGLSWNSLFDKVPVASIGSIAVAPSNPSIIYVGTGEGCLRGDSSFGNGVYKSTDAGGTWTHIGLEDTQHIAAILVDPHDPNLVFIAALGHTYGPNEERGVFRSADGGKIWQKVLYKDDKTGAVDITFDPTNSHILYAALYEVSRTPWSLTSGGLGSGIYKSIDGGLTWKHLEGHGLPEGVLGKIGLAVSFDASHVYALIEAKKAGLYRCDDAGNTWRLINEDAPLRHRPWYFMHIFADPRNPETVYVLNEGVYRSMDGGKSFDRIGIQHGDCHGLWIDPLNPQRMIEGDDGGAEITVDGGNRWTSEDNQPTGQFYHVSADNQFLYRLYGAQQDGSTLSIASRSVYGEIGSSDWYPVGGGESGYVFADPANPNIVYAGGVDGWMTRYDRKAGQLKTITPWPLDPTGHGVVDWKYRFNWTSPIAISPFDPKTVYYGANVLFKTTDGGTHWSIISPDLTRDDKSKQQSSGGPVTQDDTSVEYYDTIFAVAESPVKRGLIWAGSDDGLVHITRDGGKNWSDVTPKDLPASSEVSILDASHHNAGTAYMAVDLHRLDDFTPYIYKTDDFGKTWTKITNGLPKASYVHVVREDPVRKGLLFAGTETGIFASFDDGSHWQPLQLNLPTVPVYDLVVHGDDLCVATHGRAFWILDDISPLRQWNAEVERQEAYLYTPAPAYRFQERHLRRPEEFDGDNPPNGAIIDYNLQSLPEDGVTLEILDSRRKVVCTYKSARPGNGAECGEGGRRGGGSAGPGLNRFVWDLHYPPPTRAPGFINWRGEMDGPWGVPGKYEVRLTVDGKSYTKPLDVKEDPLVGVTQADLQEQFDFCLKVRDEVSAANEAFNQIRDVREQLDAHKKHLAGSESHQAVVASIGALDQKLNDVEAALIQPTSKPSEAPASFPIQAINQLVILGSSAEETDAAPTQGDQNVFDALKKKIDEQLTEWKEIQVNDVPALNAEFRKLNVSLIVVSQHAPKDQFGHSSKKGI